MFSIKLTVMYIESVLVNFDQFEVTTTKEILERKKKTSEKEISKEISRKEIKQAFT